MNEAAALTSGALPAYSPPPPSPPPLRCSIVRCPTNFKGHLCRDESRLSSAQFSRSFSPERNARGDRARGGWNEGGRSHPREQQPADWPFYRADRSRLYEESHNGNLRSSLPSPQPHRPLTPRDLFSFASASLLLLSFFTSQHVLCVSS